MINCLPKRNVCHHQEGMTKEPAEEEALISRSMKINEDQNNKMGPY